MNAASIWGDIDGTFTEGRGCVKNYDPPPPQKFSVDVCDRARPRACRFEGRVARPKRDERLMETKTKKKKIIENVTEVKTVDHRRDPVTYCIVRRVASAGWARLTGVPLSLSLRAYEKKRLALAYGF